MRLSSFVRSTLLLSAACSVCAPRSRADAGGFASDSPQTLDTMVVTAAGFTQALINAPASISMISGTSLAERRIASLAEAMMDIEGVDVGASAGKTGGLNISIRGMPSDYTLILVDGRRQNAAGNITPNGFGETSTSFLPPPAAIERIEVIRGPMSTLYGSDAMGGVVNIITRKVQERWGGSLTVSGTLQEDRDYGDSYHGQLYLTGPLVPRVLGLTLRGSFFERFASDLTYLDEAGQPLEVSKRGPSPVAAEISTFGARLALIAHPDHDLWLDGDFYRQSYDNRNAQLGTLGEQGYEEELKFNRDQYTLAHTWRVGQSLVESSLMRNETETIGRTIPPGTPGKAPGSRRDLTNENVVFDTKAVIPIDAHTVSIGGQWWDAEMVDGVAPAPYRQEQWALFLEDEWRFRPNFAATVGGRYDEHSQFGDHFNPRAYLVWNASPRWTWKGGVSQGFKVPRLDQIAEGITGFTGQGTRPTIGTPSLKPETSTSTELGVIHERNSSFRIAATLFYNEFEDKIANGPGLLNATWAAEPNRPGSVNYGYWPAVDEFSQLINVDRAVTYGAEVSTRIRLSPVWTLTGNYTYTESEQKSGPTAGQPLYDTPRHMANARVRWEATERLSLWLAGEYRGERFRNPDSATSTAKATLGDYKAYALFNLGAGFQATERLVFNATISNLLDKDFVDYRPYVSNRNTGAISYTSVYSNHYEPRRLWLSATLTF